MKKKLLATVLSLSVALSILPPVQAADMDSFVTAEETGHSQEIVPLNEEGGFGELQTPWDETAAGTEVMEEGTVTEEPGAVEGETPVQEPNGFADGGLDGEVTQVTDPAEIPVVPGEGESVLPSGTVPAEVLQEGIEAQAALIHVTANDWIKHQDGTYSLRRQAAKTVVSEPEENQGEELPVNQEGQEAWAAAEVIFQEDTGVPVQEVPETPEIPVQSQDEAAVSEIPVQSQEETAVPEDPEETEVKVQEPEVSEIPVHDPEEAGNTELSNQGPTASETGENTDAAEEISLDLEQEGEDLEASLAELYTSKDGLLYIQTGTNKAGYYYFDEKGIMTEGIKNIPGGTPGFTYANTANYFFMNKTALKNNSATPATTTLGQLQMKYWYWDGKAFHFFADGSGREMTIPEYVKTLKSYYGYVMIKSGEYYALNDQGVPYTGCRKLTNGSYYYFSPTSTIPGQMLRNGWATGKEGNNVWWRYFRSNGKFVPDKGITVRRLDNRVDPTISSTGLYMLSPAGYLYKNAMRKISNGRYYYAGADGQIVKDKLVTVNGKQYYFSPAGYIAWRNQWHRVSCDQNRFYYFASDGSVVKKTGWQSISVGNTWYGWYYFTSSGKHYLNKLLTSNYGYSYYFRSNGALASGKTLYNGKYYYFSPSDKTNRRGQMLKGAISEGNKITYYANTSTGVLLSGWRQINGSWYLFSTSTYAALRNQSAQKNGEWGYLDGNGVWRNGGWVRVEQADGSEKSYYVNPANGEYYKNCWQTVDGFNYYFTADGSVCTTVDKLPGFTAGGYSVRLNRARNIMTVFTADGKTPIRSFTVSVGKAETPTITGSYVLTSTGQRWTELMGPSWGQWAMNISGGYFIHSVPNSRRNDPYSLYRWDFCMLGTAQSHGCVRMSVSDCYWMFAHCNGSWIHISDSEPVPFGRTRNYWIPEDQTYDPTDWNVPENHLTGPVW